MKVLYVITQSDVIGGASVHVLDLAAGVQTQGNQVEILAGGQGVLHERARKMGLSSHPLRHLVREISPLHDLLCFFELRREFRRQNPDIVHLHSTKAGVLGRLVAFTLGMPVVFTVHGWSFTDGIHVRRAWFYRQIERFVAVFANRIIAVSEYDRQLALSAGVGKPALITTVRNGMPGLDASASATTSAENAEPRIIMVARFDDQKNQSDLVRALAPLKDMSWRLELVGDGPLRPAVQALAQELGLADRVEFPGSCNDVPARLARSDIFALVTNWEGLPLSILEGMRAGLPVVASDVGGVSEAVFTGETGFLAKRGDVGAVTTHLKSLLASPETRQKMGQAGRARFESEFTFQQMLDNTMAVYREVLAERHR